MGLGPQYTRWTVLSIGLLVESIGGLFYMFGVYSQDLKERSWPGGEGEGGTLTQAQVSLIGSLSNIGGNLSPQWGFFYDAYGPRPTVVAGGLMGVVSWFLLYAALKYPGIIKFPFWSLLAIAFFQGNSQAVTDCATVPTMATLFPQNRGGAIGLTKAFVGLSGAMVTTIYVGLFRPDIESFMLFLTVLIAAVTVIATVFYNPAEPPNTRTEDVGRSKAHFNWAYIMAFFLAAELLAAALLDAFVSKESETLRLVMMILMLVLFVVLMAWVATGRDLPLSSLQGSLRLNSEAKEPLLKSPGSESDVVAVWDEKALGPQDYSLWMALATVSFWLQFLTFLVAGGCGLVVINNIAQINIARGGDKNLKDVFVSLISIFNCAGRLFWGLSSDFALQRWGICRPYFFGVVAAILGGVFVLLELFSGVWVLYVAAIFGGVRSRFLVFFSILKCLRRHLTGACA